MRLIPVALGAVALALMSGGIYAIHERRPKRAERPSATEINEESTPDAVLPTASAAGRSPAFFGARAQAEQMREMIEREHAQIEEVIERRLPAIKTVEDMERYLAEVEARARANGQVTALEMEPALAAIRHLRPELGPQRTIERTTEFTQRMNGLAAELAGEDRAATPPPDLDQLAQQIASGGESREAAIRAYTQAARKLPLGEQSRAIARLNELVRPAP